MPTPPSATKPLTLDCHIDIPWVMTKRGVFDLTLNNHGQKSMTDIPRMKIAGLDAAVFALYLSDEMQDRVGPDQSKRLIQRQIDSIPIQSGVQIFLGLEGGRLIQEDLNLLKSYSKQGVRYLTITHNFNTTWADSATDNPQTKGLTQFGKAIINECGRLNILPDISHTSDDTAWAVISESTIPIIASHSGCRALLPNPRNIPDDLIKAVAARNGVVHIPFARRMIGPYWTNFIDHIDHVLQLVGEDHVGIGSDLDGAVMAEGMDNVMFWRVIPQLLDKYSASTISKIMGGNTLRLLV